MFPCTATIQLVIRANTDVDETKAKSICMWDGMNTTKTIVSAGSKTVITSIYANNIFAQWDAMASDFCVMFEKETRFCCTDTDDVCKPTVAPVSLCSLKWSDSEPTYIVLGQTCKFLPKDGKPDTYVLVAKRTIGSKLAAMKNCTSTSTTSCSCSRCCRPGLECSSTCVSVATKNGTSTQSTACAGTNSAASNTRRFSDVVFFFVVNAMTIMTLNAF